MVQYLLATHCAQLPLSKSHELAQAHMEEILYVEGQDSLSATTACAQRQGCAQ